MSTAEILRRTFLFVAAAILLVALLAYIGGGPPAVPDTLPAQLSNAEFWNMIAEFSEAGGYFRSDNFLSNETGYQRVIPVLKKSVRSGGVYVGVGPEQNFTYVVGLDPKIAFIVDIRRQNMIEHLLYKALMEESEDRVVFLSRLFSRPPPGSVNSKSSPDDLVQAYSEARRDEDLFKKNVNFVLDYLEKTKGFALSRQDETSVRYVYQAFFDSGPNMSYTFLGGYGGFMGMPTYGELMTEDDGRSNNWNFLANDEQYQKVRSLQKKNLIVPLVGDFAGPKAIRSVAEYLNQHHAVLTVFYTSNVEQYLFQDEENWRKFYANVATLPVDSSSTLIRYVLNSSRSSRRSRTLLSPIPDLLRAYNRGRIQSYFDVIDFSW